MVGVRLSKWKVKKGNAKFLSSVRHPVMLHVRTAPSNISVRMAATPRLDIIVNHVMFTEDACWMKRNGTLNLTSPSGEKTASSHECSLDAGCCRQTKIFLPLHAKPSRGVRRYHQRRKAVCPHHHFPFSTAYALISNP